MRNHQRTLLAVVFAGLMALAAGALWRLSSGQGLGEPGVVVAPLTLVNEEGGVVATNGVPLPATVPGYRSEPVPVSRQELDMLPPDTTYGRRRYLGEDGFWISANVVLMGTDRTSIHKPEYCLPGQGFQIVSRERDVIRLEVPHPYDLPVMRLVANKEARDREGRPVTVRAVYVYWFMSDTHLATEHLERMWLMTEETLRSGRLPRWAYASYLAIGLPGQEAAVYDRIRRLIQATVPEFQRVTGPRLLAAAGPVGSR
jgi:hypothetical protein